jgi:hypothetical protein
MDSWWGMTQQENSNESSKSESQQSLSQTEGRKCCHCGTLIPDAVPVCYECGRNQKWWKNQFRIDHIGLLIALAMMLLSFLQFGEVKKERKDAHDAANQAQAAAQDAQKALAVSEQASKHITELAGNAGKMYEELQRVRKMSIASQKNIQEVEENTLYRINNIEAKVIILLKSDTVGAWNNTRATKGILTVVTLYEKNGKKMIQFFGELSGTILGKNSVVNNHQMFIPYEQEVLNQPIDFLSAVSYLEIEFVSWRTDSVLGTVRNTPIEEMIELLSQIKEIQIQFDLNRVAVAQLMIKDRKAYS